MTTSTAAAMVQPRIAIIGGGAAGLAAARVLTRSHPTWEVRVLERKFALGGVWRYDEATSATTETNSDGTSKTRKQHPMYRNLRTNLPKEVMAYREFPWLDDLHKNGGKSFMTHAQVLEYLQDYAKQFDLEKYIQWNANVKQLTIVADQEEGHTSSSSLTSSSSSLFPLQVASSETTEEKWPKIKLEWSIGDSETTNNNQDATTSTSSHQHEPANQFCELFDAVCICNGHYNLPILPDLPGLPQYFRGQIMHSISYDDPRIFQNQIVLCVGGRASGSDIAREISHYAKHVYLSDSTAPSTPLTRNTITWVPKTASVLENGNVQFQKEAATQWPEGVHVDTIIFCTGYDYQFPFINDASNLPLHCGNRRVRPLYEQLWHAVYPNLVFVGLPHSVVPFPLMELQMEAVESQWQEWTLPALANRLKAAEYDATSGGEGKNGNGRVPEDTHYLGAAQWEYCRRMAKYAQLYDEKMKDFILTNQVSFVA